MEVVNDAGQGEKVSDPERAFKALYDRYSEPIYDLVIRYLRSPDLARDVVQDIMIKLWERRETFARARDLEAYLFTAARFHAIDVLRAASRSEALKSEITRQFQDNPTYVDDAALHRDYRLFIQRIVSELPPRSREVFRLCREEEKSYAEVAEALGISRNAVRNSMVLALSRLREATLKEWGSTLPLALILLGAIKR